MSEELRGSVTVYSGGTAVVTKEYAIPDGGPLKLSIAVKKRDLDTVVASISVLGDVSLPEPLSYQPTNINPTDLTLDPNTVTKDLVTKLRGARVRLKGPGTQIIEGTLAGTQDFQEHTSQGIIKRFRVVVMAEDGDIRTIEDRNIDALTFTDENDRREIRKALQRSYQAIRPEGAFVEVTIVPNSGATKCAVRYVTTSPSPKTRYQLRQLGDKWELDAQAVVTNDSEEDWRTPEGEGVYVSVVTGEPIDFDTDLAEISRPRRQKVNLASGQALGAVVAEEEAPDEMPRTAAGLAREKHLIRKMAKGGEPRGKSGFGFGGPAREVQAEIRDVGDFAVFDCPTPLIINSNKSALVPLKTWRLGQVNPILFYNESKHPRRPWQAKKFKNETGITLGKGIAIVLNDGEFAGKALLESTQPNEEAILIHALENGVKVLAEHGRGEPRVLRIKISDGVVLYENVTVFEVVYKINNQKPVAFKLEIEHPLQVPGNDQQRKIEVTSSTCLVRTIKTVSGARFSLDLAANGDAIITVRETYFHHQTVHLQHGHGIDSLIQNFINMKHPLARNRKLLACAAAQQEVEQARRKVEEADYQVKTIEEEQERLKGLIPVTHDTDANDLKSDVANNEKRWRELKRTTIPALKEAVREKEANLQHALANLSISWTEGSSGDGTDDGGTRITPDAGAPFATG